MGLSTFLEIVQILTSTLISQRHCHISQVFLATQNLQLTSFHINSMTTSALARLGLPLSLPTIILVEFIVKLILTVSHSREVIASSTADAVRSMLIKSRLRGAWRFLRVECRTANCYDVITYDIIFQSSFLYVLMSIWSTKDTSRDVSLLNSTRGSILYDQ